MRSTRVIMELRNGKSSQSGPEVDADSLLKSFHVTLEQREELERFFRECPWPSYALLQDYIDGRPALSNLDVRHLKVWFQHWRNREKMEGILSPLINKHAELKAQNQALLLRNSQLRSKKLLLNLENRHLKEQLQQQIKGLGTVETSSSEPASGAHYLERVGEESVYSFPYPRGDGSMTDAHTTTSTKIAS